jgi:sucrose-6-phosphate hydrolase SacC (GH32 family)
MASDKLKENTENENNEDTETEETPGDGVEEEEQTVEEETPKQEIIAVETNGRTTTYELKNADKFVVKIVALGKTWIDIKNGKDYSFGQAIIEKGATESKEVDLSQESEAYIIIGNSQVEIFVNDEKIELADSPSRQDIIIKYLKEGE